MNRIVLLSLAGVLGILSELSFAQEDVAPRSTSQSQTDAEKTYSILKDSKSGDVRALAKKWNLLTRMQQWKDTDGKSVRAKYLEYDESHHMVRLESSAFKGSRVVKTEIKEPFDRLDEDEQKRVEEIRELEPEVHDAVAEELRILRDREMQKQEKKEQLAAQEKEQIENARKIMGTPELTANAYVDRLLKTNVLKEAVFLQKRHDIIQGCSETGVVNPYKMPSSSVLSVHFQTKYVSQAGLVNERESFVIVYRDNNGLWRVSQDTLLVGMNHMP